MGRGKNLRERAGDGEADLTCVYVRSACACNHIENGFS